MFQFTAPALPCGGIQTNRSASEVERFRARHRRLCRGQPQSAALSLSSKVDAPDEDEGRKRKISANWRQKQRQDRLCSQFEDGYWPKSAGTEMHLGFNAFDFSSSPEAFCDEPVEPVEEKKPTSLYKLEEEPVELPAESSSDGDKQQKQTMTEVAKQVTAMGFNGANLWQRRFPGLGQLGGPIQQLPMYGQNSMWGIPVHYATIGDQRRALYYQPTFFM
ncbi:hypothetical protein PHYSODRAFT_503501 [Phytophthora sojae]|uniref:Uncharacterized protein n=1 Tax=Phytophthora sojae (strain P6497) TaxID=1094619 RepID=G4ZD78_PHYSP|nr:hypothetical protein PHYSODRAFT_503501 [Phytophthora sojae]EGZ16883.1 hypothetical protein PHYSODRAFT_503501 [Phytophthora sojae]|eukprot:XP_009525941.1 hypothetical protein PHYSODRAFT_503501 [Phytophthora sojae]